MTLNQLNTFNKTDNTAYKASYDAKYKIENEKQVYINMNNYYYKNRTDDYYEDFNFLEIRAKEGSSAVGEFLDYIHEKLAFLEGKYIEKDTFSKYSYLSKKAFIGSQLVDGKMKFYSNSIFPASPEPGTEFAKMESSAKFIWQFFCQSNFMTEYNDIEVNDTVLDFNQHVKKEIKLYENYIVFEESSPFVNCVFSRGPETHAYYLKCLSNENTVTQTAYYNINTGQFDCFSLYGKTYDFFQRFVELDVKINLFNLDKKEAKNKVDDLVSYIKRKSN